MGKPTVKDGFHYRWYYHPAGGWEVVQVCNWDNKQCCFNRPGFSEDPNHWVKHTQPWQWGPKVKSPPAPKLPRWMYTDNKKIMALIAKVREDWKHTREMCS